jgi:uncharacterized protein YecE (DUF72 family)
VAGQRRTLKGARPKAPPPPDPERLSRASALSEAAPLPAEVGVARFGTAGWTDRTLIDSGTFYPKTASSPEGRLRYYAAHFSLVEVDATYYTLLAKELAERWLTWTPNTFRFNVKAFPLLTGHPIDVSRLPADLRLGCVRDGHEKRVCPQALSPELRAEMGGRFLDFLSPLQREGRLASVLLQFPPWFSATRENARKLEQVRHDFPDLPMAVEFRQASWLLPQRQERVFDLLRNLELSYVCIDEPGMPKVTVVTHAPLAVVRFHGHNQAGWARKGASVHERFDYLYDPSELAAWVAPLRRLTREASEVHAVFNNCVRNYAVLGAKDLAALLQDAPESQASS